MKKYTFEYLKKVACKCGEGSFFEKNSAAHRKSLPLEPIFFRFAQFTTFFKKVLFIYTIL
jgi:hypothetical protein